MLHQIKKLVPDSVKKYRTERRDRAEFDALPRAVCDVSRLAPIHRFDRAAAFGNAAIHAEWERVAAEIASLGITDKAAGVNPGDRRALFHLIRYLQPRTVLEVGTNIGASTCHIAAALRAGPHAKTFELTTIDIVDVNDEELRWWESVGSSTHAPAELMRRMGCAGQVQFHSHGSLHFFRTNTSKYDLIFLDGSHTAAQVYQEVPAALVAINDGAFVLHHDFFPDMRPLWSDGAVEAGPYLAMDRLRREGGRLEMLPLGALPWPTKLGSNVTSLAVMGRRQN